MTRAVKAGKPVRHIHAVIPALLFAAPIIAAAAAIFIVRIGLGFQFPVPWPDETGFVAPAFDLARSGSFFDAGMNPDRIVMWMPPGYMVLLAAVFRLLGYSFSTARWVSAVACLAALGLCTVIAWRTPSGWRRIVAGLVAGAAFLSPCMLIDANIARMEMPFAAVMLLAAIACLHERIFAAAALIGLDGLVHFNAVYFVPPLAAATFSAIRHRRLRPPNSPELVLCCAAAAAWLGYGVFVVAQWNGFRDDMQFQFALKHSVSLDDAAHPWWPAACGAALAIAAAFWRRLDPASMIGLFGLAFLVMAHNGHEVWYDYGQPLGFACIALALLADRNAPVRYGAAPWDMAALAAGILVLVMGTRMTAALRPLLPHRAMFHRDVVPAAGIARVRAFIATLPPGATVNFGWSGMEPFFLQNLYEAGARWSILRHSVTQVFPLRPADWRVVCDSREFPPFLFKFDIDHPRVGADTGCRIMRP